jgi:spermidine dehydrogenase
MPRRRGKQASAAAANSASRPAPPLGMDRIIARRDFLQGTLYAAASTLSGPLLAGVADAVAEPGPSQDPAGYYPPSLTGLRGSHPGSFESAHALRDGAAPAAAAPEADSYDLVIVGAGLSGLSAAHFYRSAGGAAVS